jgi:hypothetical protein
LRFSTSTSPASSAPSDHLLLIEPDAQMQQILLTEIRRAISFPVRAVTPAECPHREVLTGAIPLCRPSQAAAVRALLPPGIELTTLQIRSATAWLNPWLPAPQGHLIAVVSHWPEFLTTARTMLIAAGLPTDALLQRPGPGDRHPLRRLHGVTPHAAAAAARHLVSAARRRGHRRPRPPRHARAPDMIS